MIGVSEVLLGLCLPAFVEEIPNLYYTFIRESHPLLREKHKLVFLFIQSVVSASACRRKPVLPEADCRSGCR